MGNLAAKKVSYSATSNAKLMAMSEEFGSKMCLFNISNKLVEHCREGEQFWGEQCLELRGVQHCPWEQGWSVLQRSTKINKNGIIQKYRYG